MDALNTMSMEFSASRPDKEDLMKNLFEVNQNIVNQSAMTVRAATNYISIMEQGFYDYLKFYQRRLAGLLEFSQVFQMEISTLL